MRWAVYYADGSKATGVGANVETVPARGVIAIAEESARVGRTVTTKCDYYWWDDGWHGGDLFGCWDYLCRPGWKRVLFGRSIPADEYEAIVTRATEDESLPPKNAVDGYHRGDA